MVSKKERKMSGQRIEQRKNKLKGRIIVLILFLASFVFVVFCGYLWGAWTGFPKGHDAYAHITRIKYVLDFFPNIDWQYHWANGMPLFKSYAPLHSILGALLIKISGISMAHSVIALGFLSYLFLAISVFGIVYIITKRSWLAFLANVLVFSSFASWDWMVFGGNYPRVFALGLMFLTIFFFVKLLSKIQENGKLKSKTWLILSIIALFCMTACDPGTDFGPPKCEGYIRFLEKNFEAKIRKQIGVTVH